MDASHIFGTVLGYCWDLLSFTVPGLNIDCKSFVAGLITINISIAAVSFVFGLGGPGTGYRSGSGGKKHISENRKGDEK